jgi:hypothetical protein
MEIIYKNKDIKEKKKYLKILLLILINNDELYKLKNKKNIKKNDIAALNEAIKNLIWEL